LTISGQFFVWNQYYSGTSWGDWKPIALGRNTISSGQTNVTVSAGGTATQAITFGGALHTVPRVAATAITTNPQNIRVGIGNLTASGFSVYVYSVAAATIAIDWIAIA